MKRIRTPFKLMVLSLIISLFLHESKTGCSRLGYGLPMNFFYSYCECGRHPMPIDFIGIVVDVVYHFIIWYSVVYLWQDAKETWQMIRGEKSKPLSN